MHSLYLKNYEYYETIEAQFLVPCESNNKVIERQPLIIHIACAHYVWRLRHEMRGFWREKEF